MHNQIRSNTCHGCIGSYRNAGTDGLHSGNFLSSHHLIVCTRLLQIIHPLVETLENKQDRVWPEVPCRRVGDGGWKSFPFRVFPSTFFGFW